ncbi:WD40 repeat domain-containing protein [Streptomyces sp. NPDC059010]|uniref:WD40 repeat domain-containing protein n=1 Tax=Streptomyces sp. NPDC059010 TaxID=3346695 RepID=UPI0036A24BFE
MGHAHRAAGTLSGALSRATPGEPEEASVVAFSPDGTTLAVAGNQGTVQLWDVVSQQPLGPALPTPGDGILSLAFSPDGGTLYAAGEHVPWQKYDIDPDRAVGTVCTHAGVRSPQPLGAGSSPRSPTGGFADLERRATTEPVGRRS